MKNYQKAEMIAKNLPTGSYAAGCPAMYSQSVSYAKSESPKPPYCQSCEMTM